MQIFTLMAMVVPIVLSLVNYKYPQPKPRNNALPAVRMKPAAPPAAQGRKPTQIAKPMANASIRPTTRVTAVEEQSQYDVTVTEFLTVIDPRRVVTETVHTTITIGFSE